MRRLFLLSIGLLLLFGFTIQRDTFLRRWLLPTTPDSPLLDRRIEQISFSTDSFDAAIAHLSQSAGVRIEYSTLERPLDQGRLYGGDRQRPFVRTFRDASVDRVLRAILRY
jgi:hypothetical protein